MTNASQQPKQIPEQYRDLVERPLITALATTLMDGTPQVTPVWFSYEDGHFYFNSARGRLKDKAMRANPYVAITIVDPENPYRWLAVRGPLVEITEEGGRDHINLLAKRYMGADKYPGPETEVRVRYKLAPEHVAANG